MKRDRRKIFTALPLTSQPGLAHHQRLALWCVPILLNIEVTDASFPEPDGDIFSIMRLA